MNVAYDLSPISIVQDLVDRILSLLSDEQGKFLLYQLLSSCLGCFDFSFLALIDYGLCFIF